MVLLIVNIAISEHLQAGYNVIAADSHDVCPSRCDISFDGSTLRLQLDQPAFRGFGDDALLDGGHDVFYAMLRAGELVFQNADLALGFLALIVGDRAVGDPLDNIVLQSIVFDGLGDLQLNFISAYILFIAGLFRSTLLADVVVMQVAGASGAGDASHGAFTMPAEQLAGKQIVTIDAVTPLRILLRGDHLLDLEVKLVADNPRDAALFADIAVDIDAAIPFVGKDLLKARPPPRATVRGLDSPDIQAGHDINESLTAGNASEYLPDNRSLRLVDGIVQRFVRFIAVGQMAVRHHAIRGVVI